jgi:hypothetical protein
MEILKTLGEPATYIIAIVGVIALAWTGITYIPKGSRWLCSWTFVKREELDRLKKIAAKYPTTEAELKRLYETCAPYLEQKRVELVEGFFKGERPQKIEKPRSGETRLSEALAPFDPRFRPQEFDIEVEFDPREPLKNRRY